VHPITGNSLLWICKFHAPAHLRAAELLSVRSSLWKDGYRVSAAFASRKKKASLATPYQRRPNHERGSRPKRNPNRLPICPPHATANQEGITILIDARPSTENYCRPSNSRRPRSVSSMSSPPPPPPAPGSSLDGSDLRKSSNSFFRSSISALAMRY
jgi:hypothetical protein